jgi:Carboxypeptidase regulatory-like domain
MPTRQRLLSLAAIATLALAAFHAAPALAAGGQRGTITGTIVDASDAPVPDADVTLAGPGGRFTAHTNARGKFTLLGVLTETYTLTVRCSGTVRVNQPGIGVIGDQTVDLGKIVLPAA